MDFETRINNAEFWFLQAEQMYEASKVLFKELSNRKDVKNMSDQIRKVGCHKGALFFLGISVENAIKGYCAHLGIVTVKNERMKVKSDFKYKNHNLIDLTKISSLDLLDEEVELLERLSIYNIWAGKYGTPLSKQELPESKGKQYLRESDYPLVESFVNRLKIKSGFSNETGWPYLHS